MPWYVIWIFPSRSSIEVIKVVPYLIGQFPDFLGKPWVPFFEHIAYPFEIVLVFHQQGIMFQLFWCQAFNDTMAKGGTTAIFGKGKPGPFGLELEHLLFIDTASELDVFPFHFSFFLLRPSGEKARLS